MVFSLKALRISSPKYVNDEFDLIEIPFLTFFTQPYIHFAKSKALKIHKRNRPRTNVNAASDKIFLLHTHITLPNNSSTNIIENNLNKLGIKTVTLSYKIICD